MPFCLYYMARLLRCQPKYARIWKDWRIYRRDFCSEGVLWAFLFAHISSTGGIECNEVIHMRKRRRTNRAPAGILLLAVLVRLFCEPERLPAQIPETAPAAQSAVATSSQMVSEPAAEDPEPLDLDIPAVPETTAETDATALTTLTWNPAALETLSIRNQTGYLVSLEELSQQPLQFDESAEGPTILLIHTHTTEAYTPEPGWEYEAYDLMRTMDSNYNMVRIGNEVERILTEAGYWVIHDETINDYPSYNNSYGTALSRIEDWFARYPSIQLVLDLHRDAAADADGAFIPTSCSYGGQDTAQLMLVCGTDYGGLEHPNWRQNLAFALRLQLRLELTRPGSCRTLDLRCERFNQHTTPLSLLVEVGTVGDTLSRAIPAAQHLGTCLAEILGEI